MTTAFKEILKDFLEERKLTQREFAEKIGVKQSQVSEWVNGKSNPGYYNLRNIAINFDLDAEYWLNIENIKYKISR